jgi:circadian clock protein KaiB
MNKPRGKSARDAPGDGDIIQFRLYIAEGTPNSVRAVANLHAICQRYLHDRCQIEMTDILQEPLTALSHKVLVTPTLVKLAPPPGWRIVGDLSDRAEVLRALGLEER